MATTSNHRTRFPPGLLTPSIGWLVLDSASADAARRFIQNWTPEGSIDELGIGILRDAFSDHFFPAINTIMTEPRYLVFVPAAFRRIERGRVPGDPHHVSRELQDDLRARLSDSYGGARGKGVIGLNAGLTLARFPSDVYWAALRLLGIYRHPGDSEADNFARLRTRSDAWTADEGQMGPGGATPICWDSRFPYFRNDDELFDAKGRWKPGVRFKLTAPEARYLMGCYQGEATSVPSDRRQLSCSLFSHLLTIGYRTEFQSPWSVPLPPELEADVWHAEWLSALAGGASLHYTYRLAELAGKADVAAGVRDAFSRWWEHGRTVVLKGSSAAFMTNPLVRAHLKVERGDAAFLTAWSEAIRGQTKAHLFLDDASAGALIERRESQCKGPKSRFKSKSYRDVWNGGAPVLMGDAYLLNYRADKASVFLKRILEPLSVETR